MTTRIINVCNGWACPLNTKCGKSDYNLPEDLRGWVRHYQSPIVGEHCPDFVPLHESPWGEGAENALAD